MKRLLASLLACLVLPLAGLAAEAPQSNKADQAAVVEGNNAFAIELYGQLRTRKTAISSSRPRAFPPRWP